MKRTTLPSPSNTTQSNVFAPEIFSHSVHETIARGSHFHHPIVKFPARKIVFHQPKDNHRSLGVRRGEGSTTWNGRQKYDSFRLVDFSWIHSHGSRGFLRFCFCCMLAILSGVYTTRRPSSYARLHRNSRRLCQVQSKSILAGVSSPLSPLLSR